VDFSLTDEDEAFRADIRDFLKRHHPGKAPRGADAVLQWQRDWAALLSDEGYAAPGWPKEFGGMELPLPQQLVYHEEMTLARVPGHPSANSFIVGPTLIKHGTPEQHDRFLRRLLRADDLWCQGWSEPDAGSDLPSLKTRAVRDGDDYVVTGQKIWTSASVNADWMFALVRTGTPESRQHGLTYLLIDMRSPGLTVRPITDMSGGSHFSEVFFDEVSVPVGNRIGEENGGWSIARTSIGHERSTAFIAQDIRYRRIVRELIELAQENGASKDPLVRQQLAQLEIEVRLLGLNGMRSLSTVLKGGEPGPESSISRLFHGQFEKRLHEVAVDVTGAYGLLDRKDPHSVQRGRWVWGMLRTRASTIGAGTAEIQRNTIGERVLGLPYEPGSATP
jgi:alkylation response protein AidB-like acyl-CoA dehydrogenase